MDDRRASPHAQPLTNATTHRHMTPIFTRFFLSPFRMFFFFSLFPLIFCFVKGRHDLIPTRFLLSYLHRTGVHSVICHLFFFFLVLFVFSVSTTLALHFVFLTRFTVWMDSNGYYDRLRMSFYLYFDLDKRKKRTREWKAFKGNLV